MEVHLFERGSQAPSERLVGIIGALARVSDLEAVATILRRAAKELLAAEAVTLVLLPPLRLRGGKEGPPTAQINPRPWESWASEWVMAAQQSISINNMALDPRVPPEVERPATLRRLVMVPLFCGSTPIGALGTAWTASHRISSSDNEMLQTLADSAALALKNLSLTEGLELRVQARTAQLEALNRELEAFAYSVSHDLRTPLRAMSGFSRALLEDYGNRLDDRGRDYLDHVEAASQRMAGLIDDLLKLSKVGNRGLRHERVCLSALAHAAATEREQIEPGRMQVDIQEDVETMGDPGLLRVVFDNLFENAWKFTKKHHQARVSFSASARRDPVFTVRDNGIGFDPEESNRLFSPFCRLHDAATFPGHGIGLATVQRIVHLHGGRIWASSTPAQGAAFSWTLGSVAS